MLYYKCVLLLSPSQFLSQLKGRGEISVSPETDYRVGESFVFLFLLLTLFVSTLRLSLCHDCNTQLWGCDPILFVLVKKKKKGLFTPHPTPPHPHHQPLPCLVQLQTTTGAHGRYYWGTWSLSLVWTWQKKKRLCKSNPVSMGRWIRAKKFQDLKKEKS